FLDRLRAARHDEVARALVDVVAPAERVVLVVGDRRTVAPQLKELGFRTIRLVTPDGLPAAPAGRAPPRPRAHSRLALRSRGIDPCSTSATAARGDPPEQGRRPPASTPAPQCGEGAAVS